MTAYVTDVFLTVGTVLADVTLMQPDRLGGI
jgi:hypothetical protein